MKRLVAYSEVSSSAFTSICALGSRVATLRPDGAGAFGTPTQVWPNPLLGNVLPCASAVCGAKQAARMSKRTAPGATVPLRPSQRARVGRAVVLAITRPLGTTGQLIL